MYAPESVNRLRSIRAPIGVLLYRDGIRVEPYGQPGNDWLGAQAKKASRQGYAAIQPNALYGAIRLTRAENPKLRSQANREGLVETDAYDAFVQICRSEFEEFERVVFDEYLEPHWRSLAERRRESAEATQSYALSLTRALMYSVSQPVATANATLDRLQTLISSRRIPTSALRSELQDLHDRTANQLAQIGDAITRVLNMVDFDPNPSSFRIKDIIDGAIGDSAVSPSVVTVACSDELKAYLPQPPVREAILKLLRNAASASSQADGGSKIRYRHKTMSTQSPLLLYWPWNRP